MASSSPVSPSPAPGWLQWQPLSPLVAAVALWFLGRVWHHQFSWAIWATMVLSAWAGALIARGSEAPPGQANPRPLLLGLGLGAVAVSVALRWLPRGLVISAVPVAGLAAFQALMSLGNQSPLARRLAVAGATLGAIGVVAGVPLNWPPVLRLGLIALAVTFSWSVWKGGHHLVVVETPLILARGLVFAAGVLLPVAWWMPTGLVGELARPEHAALALLAVVAATCRSEWRKPVPSPSRLAACAVASLVLTALAAVGFQMAPAGPVRTLFSGVGTTGLLLGAGIWTSRRRGLPTTVQSLVPDLAWAGLALAALWPDETL